MIKAERTPVKRKKQEGRMALVSLADFNVGDHARHDALCPQRDKTVKAAITIIATTRGSHRYRRNAMGNTPGGGTVCRLNNGSKISRGLPRQDILTLFVDDKSVSGA